MLLINRFKFCININLVTFNIIRVLLFTIVSWIQVQDCKIEEKLIKSYE